MITLIVTSKQLKHAERWDIDFHSPPLGVKAYPPNILRPVTRCADIIKTKRDPTKQPDAPFQYVDIASIDVETGVIINPQELTGQEAPSRARKVMRAYDIIISTCRPTRGAIAVVPESLHGQICSTGFSVIRPHPSVNPFYLHFALRLPSTLEQFRKWSTGSSYPAILDEDVAKTLLPLPTPDLQDAAAKLIRCASQERDRAIRAANDAWKNTTGAIVRTLERSTPLDGTGDPGDIVYSTDQVHQRIAALGPVEEEAPINDDQPLQQSLFHDNDDAYTL
jgi:hypothetical protein